MKKLFTKKLTIKTNFEIDNADDVKKFETACETLKNENFDFTTGTETVGLFIGGLLLLGIFTV